MSELTINPWELGSETQSTGIPPFVTGNFVLVKVGPTKKTGDIRDGLVGTFVMTSYFDANGKKVELVIAKETPSGYKIEFPFGKRNLIATKFRGKTNFYRFAKPDGSKMDLKKEVFTTEFAEEHLSKKIAEWDSLSEATKAEHIDEYFNQLYQFGLSQDLMLPVKEDGSFTAPFVGMRTSLYRVYTPAKDGEKWPDIKVTKWESGQPNLDGDYSDIGAPLAEAIYEAVLAKEEDKFDPSTFVESNDDTDDDTAPF